MKITGKKFVFQMILVFVLILSIPFNTFAASFRLSGENIQLSSNQPIKKEEEETEEDWDDWENADFSTISNETEISSVFTPKLVSENNLFKFWYDTTGADIYILDKRSGHIWSNTVNDDYYHNESASLAMRSLLFQVTVCDEEGSVSTVQLCDAVGDEDNFNLTAEYKNKEMILKVELVKFSITFQISFYLTEKGLTVSVPAEAIKQDAGNKIVSLSLMPYFGAARTDLDGYLLIPDGCGALVRFNNMDSKEERVYSYSLYGQSTQNMNTLLSRDDQDIKNMMLPVFGVKNDKNGFLAAVAQGAENTTVNIVPYGYQCPKLARCYYTFMYLYTADLAINGRKLEQVMLNQELSDREVQFFLLDSECEYSDMARVYRKYLEDTDILKEKIDRPKTGISLDIVMGVKKNGMFFDSLVKMTEFEEVKTIVSDLKKSGIENLEISLKGWNKGGITELTTPCTVASGLGGKKELKALLSWLTENSVDTYLYSNFSEAKPDSKNVNTRKEIIRDYVGTVVMNLQGTTVMVNPCKAFNKFITSAVESGLYKNSGFSLGRAGQWLWNSYESGNENTRTQAMKAFEQGFENCAENSKALQIYGGNQYVLKFADSLREIPDMPSKYYYETDSVPFYQLVVNGYVNYTSVAGNMSYDTEYQKLKWIEYGSTPYYIITDENSLKLVDTGYGKLFSSEYDVWGEQIKAVNDEFKTRLSLISGAEMVSHKIISDTVNAVTYSNGYTVYINYGSDAVKIGNTDVGAMDYCVVKQTEGGVKS